MLTFFPRWEFPCPLLPCIDLAVRSVKVDWRKGVVRALSQTIYGFSLTLHVHRTIFTLTLHSAGKGVTFRPIEDIYPQSYLVPITVKPSKNLVLVRIQ